MIKWVSKCCWCYASLIYFMKYNFYFLLVLLVMFSACENTTEDFITETYKDYYPLQVGKYITYRVDSVRLIRNGQALDTVKRQVKHFIESEGTDNLNNKIFIVQKYVNNQQGTGPWLQDGNYTVTPFDARVEVVENNLRSIKMQNPLRAGFTWRGYSYLPDNPYKAAYDLELVGNEMQRWNFTYKSFGNETINNQAYNNVWTVVHSDTTFNIPSVPINSLGVKEVDIEKYAKNIGLVYRNFQLLEHQPANADNPSPYYRGFGVTMWMVDHN